VLAGSWFRNGCRASLLAAELWAIAIGCVLHCFRFTAEHDTMTGALAQTTALFGSVQVKDAKDTTPGRIGRTT